MYLYLSSGAAHTAPVETQTHTLSVYPHEAGYLCKQSARSPLPNNNHADTHPPDDGIGEQDEFEENVRASVAVSDLVVAGHRDRGQLSPAALCAVDSTLPRCCRQSPHLGAHARVMDG